MATLSEDMKRVVREQRLGYVATVSGERHPNVSPKGSIAVWDDDHLIFADVESSRTIRNLETNPNVEVNVVDPEVRQGYRFNGTATVLRTGDLHSRILEHYKAEGADIRRVRSTVVIEVRGAAPLISPAYLTGLTQDEVRALWVNWYKKTKDKLVVDLIPPNDF